MNVEEERDTALARFLAGLNRKIANTVELHPLCEARGYGAHGDQNRDQAQEEG